MKPWPEKPDYWNDGPPRYPIEYWSDIGERDYERARAEAAIERLRVAEEALKLAAMAIGCACACKRCSTASDRVHKAIDSIGDIP